MTKLNHAQKDILDELQAAKLHYDKWEADALAQLAVLRNQAKEPIRKLVGRAVEAKVPIRQIHLTGLGLKQVAQLTTFLDSSARSPKDAIVGMLNPEIAPAKGGGVVPAPTEAAPKIKQDGIMASWEAEGGKRKQISRLIGPNFAYIVGEDWDEKLNDEERKMFLADEPRTLIGDEEYAAFEAGVEPDRWSE